MYVFRAGLLGALMMVMALVSTSGPFTAQTQQAIFSDPANFAAGSEPSSVMTADFDGNGLADIATANQGSENVSVLLNTTNDVSPVAVDDACTIKGTGKDDVRRGTAHRDVICGAGGNDTLKGLDGNDLIRGGVGNDTIYGGAGNDSLKGGAGRDELYGNKGTDRLYGNKGTDRLYGGPGKDVSQR
jgi:Ca2+-binding RTX toxin-like protein